MANDNKDQLLNIFLTEATELIETLSSVLKAWQIDLNDLQKVKDLKREFHTLKGSALMVGEATIATVAEKMETLCNSLINKQINIDNNTFEQVRIGLDRISEITKVLRKQKECDTVVDLTQKAAVNGNKKNLLVMVVDDSASTRAVLKQCLERHLYSVMTAGDGAEALSMLQNLQPDERLPDILLLDIDMPEMTGIELMRHLRKTKRFEKIPIIILTASSSADRREQAADLKVEAFLEKPIDEMQIVSVLQSLTGV